MKNILCTVGILTYNSEETLRRALESVKDFEEIIINDGGSTDNTLNIAKEYNVKIITQNSICKNPDGTIKDFSCAKNQLLMEAHYDWFLVIDSDEAISEKLHDEIRVLIETEDVDTAYIYNVPICIILDGKKIKHSSNYPGYQHRFFNKKSGARFVKPVHEKIIYDTNNFTSRNLTYPWHVFSTKCEAIHYIRETRKYIEMEVQRGKDISFSGYLRFYVWGCILISVKVIIKSFLIYVRYGFKNSMPIQVEIGRAVYPLLVSWGSTILRIKKILKK